MQGRDLYYLLGLSLSLVLSGCVVRTYPLTRDRIDQDLTTGNRGFIQGQVPLEEKEREKTRTTQVVEIELHSPVRFEKAPQALTSQSTTAVGTEDKSLEGGNRGYITESTTPEIAVPEVTNLEKYTVEKGDTLQKISKKFYGTTKRWNKIFQANKDVLKAPNKIYPGQVINIPVEPGKKLTEPRENLK